MTKNWLNRLAYGATYAQRYRSWLHKTGIIELDFPLRLTAKGEVVWQRDPRFETLTTQWFMHRELTTDPNRTETWHWFIHEFLPHHTTFTQAELLNGVMTKLLPHSEKHFGPDGTLSPVIVRKLIECYTQDYSLGVLRLIVKKNSTFTTEGS